MPVLEIIKAPDPRLNEVCDDVPLGTVETVNLASALVETMYAKRGKGLAAPQVGVLSRMFCMRYGNSVVVMCNPIVIRRGKDIVHDTEGCLSIPGRKVRVARHKIINVEWYDVHGDKHKAKMRGDDARCVQHEIDHLDGVLIA